MQEEKKAKKLTTAHDGFTANEMENLGKKCVINEILCIMFHQQDVLSPTQALTTHTHIRTHARMHAHTHTHTHSIDGWKRRQESMSTQQYITFIQPVCKFVNLFFLMLKDKTTTAHLQTLIIDMRQKTNAHPIIKTFSKSVDRRHHPSLPFCLLA